MSSTQVPSDSHLFLYIWLLIIWVLKPPAASYTFLFYLKTNSNCMTVAFPDIAPLELPYFVNTLAHQITTSTDPVIHKLHSDLCCSQQQQHCLWQPRLFQQLGHSEMDRKAHNKLITSSVSYFTQFPFTPPFVIVLSCPCNLNFTWH